MSDDKKIMKTLNGYTVYDEDAHRRIDSLAGSAPGLVFDTVADMEVYVAEHSAGLKVGQNLYIREVNVPDYWWDGTAVQELETKVDLSGYAKQEEVDQLSEAIGDKLDKSGGTMTGKIVLPYGNINTGISNSVDTKLLGYSKDAGGNLIFVAGEPNMPLAFRGKSDSVPTYNGKELAFKDDIPSDDGNNDESGTETEEVVGTTPFEVLEEGLYVRPTEETRVYNISETENLMEQFPYIADDENVNFGTKTNTYIEANSLVDDSVATSNVVSNIYGYSAEPGEYTLLITSTGEQDEFVRVIKRTNSNNLQTTPSTNVASGYTNNVINFAITAEDVATHPCNLGIRIGNTRKVFPATYTIKLVKGKYDAMPDGTSLEFTVAAGETLSLNPFHGVTAYSEPVTNVYRKVVSSDSGGGTGETTSGTLLCFGDSLTATSYSMYPEMLTEMGMNAINFGVSASCLRMVDESNELYPYCMCRIVDCLKAGDLSSQIAGGKNANYSNLLSLIPTATGIVIWYGTNDYNGDCAFEGNTTDTIEGALRYVLTELFTLYPKKSIYVVSPFMYTYAYGHQPDNPNGTVTQMVDVMRSVCEEFAVPFIDMTKESGFNQITRMTLTSDQLHPDTTSGRERLAKFMYGKLRSLGQV